MKFRNPLANARNHGSAGDGVGHWWAQRFSAILMLALAAWLVYIMAGIIGASHAEASALLARPVNAALAILFILTALYHSVLGLQVVIEDYIHQHGLELALHLIVRIAALAGAFIVVVAILKNAFGV
ncbi:succinate dehydrogenase, hydrophobic membrane anchor protein [Wenzhouxiangella marina]|uniref:Succinate dehydrogenase hydrophobic membrane anchor subunit n=1 Tax=Wenzhouxiangella marina TaxID=1579979 RepID=A0A0K0XWV1_9GAMM|nr:succinate dehydrogenase, hydrophobic membrane anchor protein [Wenzhouxiangella marina]AKS42179.1 succinate dehydrogenase [Wenzhouxiangella marina]MBB6086049.1 succinate dehydrogenase / fumarate reductase membrane anchor subunit [Wenzhouxiangella marina]